jgi:excisionase family DNA binding protein
MTYLTVREAAALLRVSDLTVRRWIWAGKLPAIRVGRVLRIKPSDVERLPQASRQSGSPPKAPRPGSAAALLEAAARCSEVVEPRYVEELERLIAEGCERPGEIGPTIA